MKKWIFALLLFCITLHAKEKYPVRVMSLGSYCGIASKARDYGLRDRIPISQNLSFDQIYEQVITENKES